MQPSLRQKITLGYTVVAALILGMSLFAFEELRLAKAKVQLEEKVSGLFETTLEIRRFERNYFLHREEADFQENARYIGQLRKQLDTDRGELAALQSPEDIAGLKARLDDYQLLMQRYPDIQLRQRTQAAALEARIRETGKELVALAQDMLTTERRMLHASLDALQQLLLFSVLAIAVLVITIGQILSRKVVQPLKQLESSIEDVARGRLEQFSMPSQDREIVSITQAVNHMLQELETRQKHLVRSEKLASLGTMLSGVAHELNNPLSNIWSSCQIMMEELHEGDIESQRELLDQIDQQSVRARNIVRSLLDFARDRHFIREAVELQPLVQETVKFIRGELQNGVAITLDVPPGLAIFADRQRIQQVFLNLIKNAAEAAGAAGRITVSARRGISPTEGGHEIAEITVQDNGAGIQPDDLPRIFDPFFTTKPIGRGMGLGLFIVHQIIEEHDGSIQADSTPGHGTTFTIRIPMQGPQPASPETMNPMAEPE